MVKQAPCCSKFVCDWIDPATKEPCMREFNERGNLQVHLRVHTGVKPYKCQYCNKWFTTIGNRNDHERRHYGDKPYQCPVKGCNACYYRKYQLLNHGNSRKHKNIPKNIFRGLLEDQEIDKKQHKKEIFSQCPLDIPSQKVEIFGQKSDIQDEFNQTSITIEKQDTSRDQPQIWDNAERYVSPMGQFHSLWDSHKIEKQAFIPSSKSDYFPENEVVTIPHFEKVQLLSVREFQQQSSCETAISTPERYISQNVKLNISDFLQETSEFDISFAFKNDIQLSFE